MRESSPCGKFNDKSTRTNLCLGVDAAEGARLLSVRSCGHVKVQDWNATVFDCWSRGGTAITSAPLRYFSIRRRETKLWANDENTLEWKIIENIPEACWWKFRVEHWAQTSSPRKLHKNILLVITPLTKPTRQSPSIDVNAIEGVSSCCLTIAKCQNDTSVTKMGKPFLSRHFWMRVNLVGFMPQTK